jgi:hypothetical protein
MMMSLPLQWVGERAVLIEQLRDAKSAIEAAVKLMDVVLDQTADPVFTPSLPFGMSVERKQ